jgi:hypothetical protein
VSRPADDARQRARGIRDEALSRLAERDRASLDHLRAEMAEMKALLHDQRDRIASLTALVEALAAGAPLAAEAPPPSKPRPLSGHKRAVLERIRDLRARDLSFSDICEIFQSEGVPTLSGQGQWSKGTLWNLWRNHGRQLHAE